MRRRFLQLPRPSRSRTGRVSDAVYRRPGGLALMPLLLQSELRLHHHLLVHHVQSIFPMRTQTRECGGFRGCPLLTKLPPAAELSHPHSHRNRLGRRVTSPTWLRSLRMSSGRRPVSQPCSSEALRSYCDVSLAWTRLDELPTFSLHAFGSTHSRLVRFYALCTCSYNAIGIVVAMLTFPKARYIHDVSRQIVYTNNLIG